MMNYSGNEVSASKVFAGASCLGTTFNNRPAKFLPPVLTLRCPNLCFHHFFRTFAYQDGFIGCGIPFLPLESYSAFRSFSLGGNSRVRRVRASVQEETNILGRSLVSLFSAFFPNLCLCLCLSYVIFFIL